MRWHSRIETNYHWSLWKVHSKCFLIPFVLLANTAYYCYTVVTGENQWWSMMNDVRQLTKAMTLFPLSISNFTWRHCCQLLSRLSDQNWPINSAAEKKKNWLFCLQNKNLPHFTIFLNSISVNICEFFCYWIVQKGNVKATKLFKN